MRARDVDRQAPMSPSSSSTSPATTEQSAPFMRLFFEVYALTLREPERFPAFLDTAVDDWLPYLTRAGERHGLSHRDDGHPPARHLPRPRAGPAHHPRPTTNRSRPPAVQALARTGRRLTRTRPRNWAGACVDAHARHELAERCSCAHTRYDELLAASSAMLAEASSNELSESVREDGVRDGHPLGSSTATETKESVRARRVTVAWAISAAPRARSDSAHRADRPSARRDLRGDQAGERDG